MDMNLKEITLKRFLHIKTKYHINIATLTKMSSFS